MLKSGITSSCAGHYDMTGTPPPSPPTAPPPPSPIPKSNQSVENDGLVFVKGAIKRNGFFEKIKKTVIYYEQVRTNKAID